MATSAPTLNLPQPSDYGAVELKVWIAKYTWRSFFITMVLLILFFLLYKFTTSASGESETKKIAPIVKLHLENLPPPSEKTEEAAPPPPSQQVVNTGPAARAGTPIPVPDAEISEDLQEFAAMEELSRASAEGGEGLDLGGFASNVNFDEDENVDVKHKEEYPAPDEFIAVEKEPDVDLAALQKKVEYPDVARRAGIEGKVIVRVLVDKNGRVIKTKVWQSDSELLNEAAVKAVEEHGVFTPGIQNGEPVTCWVSIPIRFRLR